VVILGVNKAEAQINPHIPPPPYPKADFATSTLLGNQNWIDSYIRMEAKQYGVNPDIAAFIVKHESQDGRNMSGDSSHSRGYWQISDIYHPEVSTACAMSLECSTDWSLNKILNGKISEWSAWKFRCRLYPYDNPPNCPF